MAELDPEFQRLQNISDETFSDENVTDENVIKSPEVDTPENPVPEKEPEKEGNKAYELNNGPIKYLFLGR